MTCLVWLATVWKNWSPTPGQGTDLIGLAKLSLQTGDQDVVDHVDPHIASPLESSAGTAGVGGTGSVACKLLCRSLLSVLMELALTIVRANQGES
jgi:hypothetical protein